MGSLAHVDDQQGLAAKKVFGMASSITIFGIFIPAPGIMLNNLTIMHKRASEKERELEVIRTIAKDIP